MVLDDFLDETDYLDVRAWAGRLSYRHINTLGPVNHVWSATHGFPLRGTDDFYCTAGRSRGAEVGYAFPYGQGVDQFIRPLNRVVTKFDHIVGSRGSSEGWQHYSVSAWIYPPDTGLSLHCDGAGIYTGAFVFFLTQQWRPHWGGLLAIMDEMTNESMNRQSGRDPDRFFEQAWLDPGARDDAAMERGLGHFVLPRRNRLVLIAPHAYHLVTKVLPECGDNLRLSLAGFFHRKTLPRTG